MKGGALRNEMRYNMHYLRDAMTAQDTYETVIRNRNTIPGWAAYLGECAFYSTVYQVLFVTFL